MASLLMLSPKVGRCRMYASQMQGDREYFNIVVSLIRHSSKGIYGES